MPIGEDRNIDIDAYEKQVKIEIEEELPGIAVTKVKIFDNLFASRPIAQISRYSVYVCLEASSPSALVFSPSYFLHEGEWLANNEDGPIVYMDDYMKSMETSRYIAPFAGPSA